MARLEIECLKTLPLPEPFINGVWEERWNWDDKTRKLITRLCLSHERLRAEVRGCHLIIEELEKKCPEKL